MATCAPLTGGYEKGGLFIMVEYYSYLRSAEWQAIRGDALARAGHRCESCGSPYALQVHHRHYRTLGNESLDDLQVLCDSCHRAVHGLA